MVDMLQRGQVTHVLLDKLEDYADWRTCLTPICSSTCVLFIQLIRKTRRYLPHFSRLCLVSTFIEDGFRLTTQWSDQIDYIKAVWHAPALLAGLFILINIVTQFVGSGFVLSRFQVHAGVFILMATVVLQVRL
ncbi:Surfeit locus protein 4 [Fasciolopsis buskii]|uniref:Surfeit locus protein 4 n=1 Tax=Fasciolopsis buskii TaxID=27845 RepID=A0A8E0RP78_9TREM|nr:Surfeit locus protein 4 [Fasciolopsis buski]